MPLRVRHKVNVQIYESSSETNCFFAPNDTAAAITMDSHARHTAKSIQIADGATEAVDLGDIASVGGLYLKTDQSVVLTINFGAGAVTVPVTASPSNSGSIPLTGKFFIEAPVTALSIQKPSTPTAVVANVVLAVWGT